MKNKLVKKVSAWLIFLLIALSVALFFTNDFGLVDLRKTSVIIGVGVDFEDDGLLTLSAQLAVPMPAENGENTQFAVVTGKGKSVAEALNDVNVKTGFYPKLVFCRLIVVGESCFGEDINARLNYFFSNEYSGLNPKIAACEGRAEKLFSMQLPYGDSVTDSVDRLLSDEAQKSANVSTINLNEFGQGYYSKSRAAYMPYIKVQKVQTPTQENAQTEGGGGEKLQSNTDEFYCGQTAIFSGGVCVGILNKRQAFALNLIKGGIRRTYVSLDGEDSAVTLSVRNCKGGSSFKLEGDMPLLKITFSAVAKLQDDSAVGDSQRSEVGASPPLLRRCEKELVLYMQELYDYCKEVGCDLLGVRDMLFKREYSRYNSVCDSVLNNTTVLFDVKLKSVS